MNLVHALVETVSQLLGVLGGLGQALGHFVNNFLAPLPLVWKIPALVVGAVVLILGFLALSGYQFSTLLFTFGPARSGFLKFIFIIIVYFAAKKKIIMSTTHQAFLLNGWSN